LLPFDNVGIYIVDIVRMHARLAARFRDGYLFILICEMKQPFGMCCFALGLNWLIQYSTELESYLSLLFGENSIIRFLPRNVRRLRG